MDANTCPTCGSDCNERDELTKAEREITRLSAEVDALKRTHDEAMKRSHEVTQEMARQFETEVEALRADAQAVAALLPGPYYMDPPDGGSVTVIEQLRRMAADAARYRWLRDGSNPPWVMQMLERYADNGSDFDAEVDAARAPQGDKT